MFPLVPGAMCLQKMSQVVRENNTAILGELANCCVRLSLCVGINICAKSYIYHFLLGLNCHVDCVYRSTNVLYCVAPPFQSRKASTLLNSDMADERWRNAVSVSFWKIEMGSQPVRLLMFCRR